MSILLFPFKEQVDVHKNRKTAFLPQQNCEQPVQVKLSLHTSIFGSLFSIVLTTSQNKPDYAPPEHYKKEVIHAGRQKEKIQQLLKLPFLTSGSVDSSSAKFLETF